MEVALACALGRVPARLRGQGRGRDRRHHGCLRGGEDRGRRRQGQVASGSIQYARPFALIASAGPVQPSADWLRNPQFKELTPWTVTKEAAARPSGRLGRCTSDSRALCSALPIGHELRVLQRPGDRDGRGRPRGRREGHVLALGRRSCVDQPGDELAGRAKPLRQRDPRRRLCHRRYRSLRDVDRRIAALRPHRSRGPARRHARPVG